MEPSKETSSTLIILILHVNYVLRGKLTLSYVKVK